MLHDLFHTLEAERWTKERNKQRTQLQQHSSSSSSSKAASVGVSGSGSAEGGGLFSRVGGFDLLYDEVGGGLRLDSSGRALCCLGLWNDREGELQALWRRMAKLEAEDREIGSQVCGRDEREERQAEGEAQGRLCGHLKRSIQMCWNAQVAATT